MNKEQKPKASELFTPGELTGMDLADMIMRSGRLEHQLDSENGRLALIGIARTIGEAEPAALAISEKVFNLAGDPKLRKLVPSLSAVIPGAASRERERSRTGDERYDLFVRKVNAARPPLNPDEEKANQRMARLTNKVLEEAVQHPYDRLGDWPAQFAKDFSDTRHQVFAAERRQLSIAAKIVREDPELLASLGGDDNQLTYLSAVYSNGAGSLMDLRWLIGIASSQNQASEARRPDLLERVEDLKANDPRS